MTPSFASTPIKLNTVKRKLALIFSSVGFAFIFLNIFRPFGLYFDENTPAGELFFELLIACIVAFGVLLFSQFILRDLIGFKRLSLRRLMILFILEALLVGSFWFLLDYIEKGILVDILTDWLDNFLGYLLIMFVPYFGFAIIIQLTDIFKEKQQLLSKKDLESENPNPEIRILDENNSVRLITRLNNILYFQSAENYIELYYTENGLLKKELVRNSLKEMEKSISDIHLLRCHRSYIINTLNVNTVRKTSSGLSLSLNTVKEKLIPVSRAYVSEILKQLG